MGQVSGAFSAPAIDRQSLYQLETQFISPEISNRGDVAARQEKLARVISDEIVPLLLRLHTEVVPNVPPVNLLIEALAPTHSDITGLADIVLGNDLVAAATYVTVLRDRGLSMDALFVELLEPTARYLGELWNEDRCDFIDVTLGVARLQKLLAIFNNTHTLPALDKRRRVLMALTPGDQHYFGVTMVEKFLLAAGWKVQTELSATAEEIAVITRDKWFAVVGFTMASDDKIDSLKSTIGQVRSQSKNPAIGVMVGGPMFTATPSLAHEVGADATATNAPAAVLVAQKLFDLAIASFRSV